MIIYKITNTITNKIYIGQTKNSVIQRWRLHLRNAFVDYKHTKICNSIRKHGADNFTISEYFILFGGPDKDTLNEYEKLIIKDLNCTNSIFGYKI